MSLSGAIHPKKNYSTQRESVRRRKMLRLNHQKLEKYNQCTKVLNLQANILIVLTLHKLIVANINLIHLKKTLD